ncbi:hypothetical protein ACFLV0_05845 [Chloroflexota bacterium]
MENFVLAGKAKPVFQIIDLMAKGEEFTKKQEAERKTMDYSLITLISYGRCPTESGICIDSLIEIS